MSRGRDSTRQPRYSTRRCSADHFHDCLSAHVESHVLLTSTAGAAPVSVGAGGRLAGGELFAPLGGAPSHAARVLTVPSRRSRFPATPAASEPTPPKPASCDVRSSGSLRSRIVTGLYVSVALTVLRPRLEGLRANSGHEGGSRSDARLLRQYVWFRSKLPQMLAPASVHESWGS